MNSQANAKIARNEAIHDEMASGYDEAHVEIFNETEQARIAETVSRVLSMPMPESAPIKVLDFGAGTGNLTHHFLRKGASVIAADVSIKSLDLLRTSAEPSAALETFVLNGVDLAGIPSASVDVVATYSVLHHVPEYLPIINEFTRIVRPGGIIYIDHEACPDHWDSNKTYLEYVAELGGDHLNGYLYSIHRLDLEPAQRRWRRRATKVFSVKAWKRLAVRQWTTPDERVETNGDIHVFADKHIDWDAILSRLESGCEIMDQTDYLVCRERGESPSVWPRYRDRVSDMRTLIARK